MGIERFFVHDLTFITAAVVEGRYGQELDWSDDAVTRTRVKGWVSARQPADLAFANRDEASHRDADVSYWEAYVPAGTEVDPQQRVEVHGHNFEIIGHPRPGFTPGGVHHIEFLLKVVEG